ncbi:DUF2442 domain-containing protein [bacterium]|nr:DUF2442 domain-containing protein [bacterium]
MHVRFDDGHEGDVDFASTIAIGGIYSPLASREFFGAFRIGRNGRTLEWPAPDGSFDETRVLDFCADALWLEVTDREHPISD